jgi:hypothetical protein
VSCRIQDADLALAGETCLPWALSHDTYYQMSNRFAWAWKLTELGLPVILIYIGFLGAEEMLKKNQNPFLTHEQWDHLVKLHSATLFPNEVWGREWKVHWQSFTPIIRAVNQPLAVIPSFLGRIAS